MTATTFVALFAALSLVSALLTEAIKKINPKSPLSLNIISLICAIVVGGGGMVSAYILLDIAFCLKTILCIFIMVFSVWIGAMVGYDKVQQTINQIVTGKKIADKVEDSEE